MVLPGTKGRKRIYLMRHGDVSYVDADGRPVNPRSVQLTAQGRAHVAAAADLLAPIEFDRVLCSGLPRTNETAAIVAEGRGLTVEENRRFEEITGGRLSKMPPEHREAAFVYGMERAAEPGASFAGGEVFEAFEARVTGAFDQLVQEVEWRRMLLVCHDVVNRMILSHVCGAGLAGLGAFEQDMACVNVIDVDVIEGQVERCLIKAVNITPYNTAKDGMYKTSLEQVFSTLFDF